MGSLQTPTDQNKSETDAKHVENDAEKSKEVQESHRFEGKVTPEQELSASVARKRRNISRKRSESGHRPRDVTPARDLLPEANTDEEQPKTPDRKVRKTSSASSTKSGNDTNTTKEANIDLTTTKPETAIETTENINGKDEQPKTPGRKVKKTNSDSSSKSGNDVAVIKEKDDPTAASINKDEQPKTPGRKVKKTNSDSSNKSGNDPTINKETDENSTNAVQENVVQSKEQEEGFLVVQVGKEDEQPKTPGRKVRKSSSDSSNKSANDTTVTKADHSNEEISVADVKKEKEATIETNADLQPLLNKGKSADKAETIEVKADLQPLLTKDKSADKEEVIEVNADLQSLLNKAKSASTAPREKPARMKRDKLLKKRSQSLPRPANDDDGTKEDLEEKKVKLKREKDFVDSRNYELDSTEINSTKKPGLNLVEDFKQAQILCAKLEILPDVPLASSSESSVESTGSEGKVRRRTQYAPAAQQYLERRRLEKALSAPESESPPESKKEQPAKKRRMTFKELKGHWKEFKVEHSDECEKIRDMRNRCINDVSLLIIFCGIGGIIFKFTEGAFENFYKCGVKRVKRDFIDFLWLRSHNLREEDWKALARTKLRDFEEQLHVAHEAGVHSYSGQRSWTFLNGIVYCLTVVTTIGKQSISFNVFNIIY